MKEDLPPIFFRAENFSIKTIRLYAVFFLYQNRLFLTETIVIPQQNSSLLPLQLYCSYELHFEDIF